MEYLKSSNVIFPFIEHLLEIFSSLIQIQISVEQKGIRFGQARVRQKAANKTKGVQCRPRRTGRKTLHILVPTVEIVQLHGLIVVH